MKESMNNEHSVEETLNLIYNEIKNKHCSSSKYNQTFHGGSIDCSSVNETDIVPDSSKITQDAFSLLDEDMKEILSSSDINQLFSVQENVIPLLLDPFCTNDLCISSPTGTGKTLAYVLPIVQRLRKRLINRLRVLVIVPTKDLVIQVRNVFRKFATGTDLMIVGLTGSISSKQQSKFFADGSIIDVLICTPGKLCELFRKESNLDLSQLEYFVIDEADKVFEREGTEWYFEVARRAYVNAKYRAHPTLLLERSAASFIPFRRLLFSATLTRNEAKLTNLNLSNAITVNVCEEKYSYSPNLQEYYFIGREEEKIAFLLYLLSRKGVFGKILCFTNTIKTTAKLSMVLSQISQGTIGYFTGEKSIQERHALLESFKHGKLNILVCTDGVARGVDFENVDCVINFELPIALKTYVHRVGRTARAGKSGTSISLVIPSEVHVFKHLMKDHYDALKPFIIDSYNQFKELNRQIENFASNCAISNEEFDTRSFLLSQFNH